MTTFKFIAKDGEQSCTIDLLKCSKIAPDVVEWTTTEPLTVVKDVIGIWIYGKNQMLLHEISNKTRAFWVKHFAKINENNYAGILRLMHALGDEYLFFFTAFVSAKMLKDGSLMKKVLGE